MKHKALIMALIGAQLALGSALNSTIVLAGEHDASVHAEEEVEKGPNNGRMLRNGEFAIELAIFERGVPPEFRVFGTIGGTPIAANELNVEIQLERLGDGTDQISFDAEGDYLRGNMEVYEPHSFVVNLSAKYQGKTYQWSYDNFEGRTKIQEDLAKSMEIETELVSSQLFNETIDVFGKLVLPPKAQRHISARFPGEIKTVAVEFGQKVTKGQLLMTIESNESLQPYSVYSPIDGSVTFQDAGEGEQTGDSTLLTITSTKQLVAELNVFPSDVEKVEKGNAVKVSLPGSQKRYNTNVIDALPLVNEQQAKVYRAPIDNTNGELRVGQFVKASIVTDTFDVPMAVKTSGLQAFRDFTVVFAKVGEQYEVRMLELGRESDGWIEVLAGIKSGTEYVSNNSYIIKADIDKSGASHDH